MKTRNVLNVKEVESWISQFDDHLTEHPHILAWMHSTYRRWVLQESPWAVEVVVDAAGSSIIKVLHGLLRVAKLVPAETDLQALLADQMEFVESSKLPDWATATKDLKYVRCPTDVGDVIHMLDYLKIHVPAKPMRHKVSHVETGIRIWDRRLARQKLMGSLTDGVEVIDSPTTTVPTPLNRFDAGVQAAGLQD